MEYLYSWLNYNYLDIAIWQYLLSFVIILVSIFLKQFIEVVFIERLIGLFAKISSRYNRMLVEALGKPLSATVILGGIYLSIMMLRARAATHPLTQFLQATYSVAFGVIIIWAIYRLVEVLTAYLDEVATRRKSTVKQFIPLINRSIRIFVVIMGTMTLLASLEVNVAGLVTGLGIGGAAFALAAQDSIGNFFGSLGILADRPFDVGDWIKVGDKVDGFVEEIGFRSTKIRTFPRTLTTVPNKLLASEVIDNHTRMPKRRVKQTIGVAYETTPEQLEALMGRMREILQEDEGIHPDFVLVRFAEFGAYALDILVIYFTLGIFAREHYEVKERINLKFMRVIQEMGLSIAFPTQTVHLANQTQPAQPAFN